MPMSKRTYVEIDATLKKDVQLFCFLNQRTERAFATEAVQEKLAPFTQWLASVRKLRSEPSVEPAAHAAP